MNTPDLIAYAECLVADDDKFIGRAVIGLLLFGSRAQGRARETSDVDLLIVVSGAEEDFAYHHRGMLGQLMLEAPIGTCPSLERAIERNHPALTPILAEAVAVYERSPAVLAPLQERARRAVEQAILALEEEMARLDAEAELQLCRLEYQDQRTALAAALADAPLAGMARLTDLLLDFYRDVLLLEGAMTNDGAQRRELAMELYRTKCLGATRMLDTTRYGGLPWFQQLVTAITAHQQQERGQALAARCLAEFDAVAHEVIGSRLMTTTTDLQAITVRRG